MNYLKFCLLPLVLVQFAHAQAYRPAPARIYVAPDGTTRIIPSTVDSNTPTRYYDPRTGRYYDAPSTATYTPPPTSSQLHVMNWSELRQAVITATRELDVDLQPLDVNNSWKRGLQTVALREMMTYKTDQAPDQFMREQLQSILLFYEATRADRDSGVSHLASIRTIQTALNEILSSPQERQRRQLVVNARELDQHLARFGTGAQWRTYLKFPDEVVAIEQSDDDNPEPEMTEELIDRLVKLQLRFEKIENTPDYYQIASLISFQATSRDLASFLEMLRPLSEENAETLTASEALPRTEEN